jgi:hypothetical protein
VANDTQMVTHPRAGSLDQPVRGKMRGTGQAGICSTHLDSTALQATSGSWTCDTPSPGTEARRWEGMAGEPRRQDGDVVRI